MAMEPIRRREGSCIDGAGVKAVQGQMISDSTAQSLAELFKILGETTRVKILFSMMCQELCVCDLAAVIGTSDSAISHQLRILRSHKLVRFRRQGKVLYYSLDDQHVPKLLEYGLEHLSE